MDAPFISLFDIRISTMTLNETAAYLEQAIAERVPHQVVTVNPIILMEGQHNPLFQAVLQQADLVVPDGAGVVWAARYVGKPVAERVAGIDLVHEIMRRGENKQYRVYLLGAAPGVIATAAEKLRERFPGIQIVGYRDGYFGEAQDAEVIAAICEAKPDILLVGRSMMTQEPWIAKYREQLGVPIMMGVGGSFDVIAGRLKRAPVIFQRAGLEWLYRLAQEPKRFIRMLALPKFVLRVMRNKKRI